MVGKWKKVGNFGENWEAGEGVWKRENKREAEIGDGYVLAGNMQM